jgi:hypothetical protein
MPTYDMTCLYSTLKNISGGTTKFPFVPPHGVELDADEEVTVFGDIREAVNRGDRSGRINMDSLKAALQEQWIEIRNTPAPILTDLTSDANKMLTLDDGSLAVADPCWETSVSV